MNVTVKADALLKDFMSTDASSGNSENASYGFQPIGLPSFALAKYFNFGGR